MYELKSSQCISVSFIDQGCYELVKRDNTTLTSILSFVNVTTTIPNDVDKSGNDRWVIYILIICFFSYDNDDEMKYDTLRIKYIYREDICRSVALCKNLVHSRELQIHPL